MFSCPPSLVFLCGRCSGEFGAVSCDHLRVVHVVGRGQAAFAVLAGKRAVRLEVVRARPFDRRDGPAHRSPGLPLPHAAVAHMPVAAMPTVVRLVRRLRRTEPADESLAVTLGAALAQMTQLHAAPATLRPRRHHTTRAGHERHTSTVDVGAPDASVFTAVAPVAARAGAAPVASAPDVASTDRVDIVDGAGIRCPPRQDRGVVRLSRHRMPRRRPAARSRTAGSPAPPGTAGIAPWRGYGSAIAAGPWPAPVLPGAGRG